jgi:hypothetical protein
MKATTRSADVVSVPRALLHKIENDSPAAKQKIALLIRLSEAESTAERDGFNTELEHLAWSFIKGLSCDVLRYLEEVERAAECHTDGFAMLPDGGAR